MPLWEVIVFLFLGALGVLLKQLGVLMVIFLLFPGMMITMAINQIIHIESTWIMWICGILFSIVFLRLLKWRWKLYLLLTLVWFMVFWFFVPPLNFKP